MGLAHILCLKDYLKGIFFAALDVAFVVLLPFVFSRVHGLITQKDRSIFMLVDGILALSIAAIFAVMYFLSVRSAKSGYRDFCQRKSHITARLSLSQDSDKAFPIFALAPAFLLIVFFVIVPLVFSACVFSRFTFVFKKPMMMMSLLVLQIFPSFVGMVAIYIILWRIGGLDTLWGLVLVYIAGNVPYNTWLVKSYIDTVPRSLDESARIEGANHFRIYRSIIMPVIKPIITFLAITSFTGPWMDFIFPKMILRSAKKQTLALGLFAFITDKKNEFTNFAAGALIVAIPFIVMFTLSQKMMVTSFGQAAVKE